MLLKPNKKWYIWLFVRTYGRLGGLKHGNFPKLPKLPTKISREINLEKEELFLNLRRMLSSYWNVIDAYIKSQLTNKHVNHVWVITVSELSLVWKIYYCSRKYIWHIHTEEWQINHCPTINQKYVMMTHVYLIYWI